MSIGNWKSGMGGGQGARFWRDVSRHKKDIKHGLEDLDKIKKMKANI